MECSLSPVDIESVEVTGVKLAVSECDVCFVIPPVVTVDTSVIETSDVTAFESLAREETEVSSVELVDVGISDTVEGLWLMLEGDEVLASPEVDVSCEVLSVRVCPFREDEGVVVITANVVLL